jgi:hypothetical protein
MRHEPGFRSGHRRTDGGLCWAGAERDVSARASVGGARPAPPGAGLDHALGKRIVGARGRSGAARGLAGNVRGVGRRDDGDAASHAAWVYAVVQPVDMVQPVGA